MVSCFVLVPLEEIQHMAQVRVVTLCPLFELKSIPRPDEHR